MSAKTESVVRGWTDALDHSWKPDADSGYQFNPDEQCEPVTLLLHEGESVGGFEPWMVEYLVTGNTSMVPRGLERQPGVLSENLVRDTIATAISSLFAPHKWRGGMKTRVMRSQPKGHTDGRNWDIEPGEVWVYYGWPHRMDVSRGWCKAGRGELTPFKVPGPKGVTGFHKREDGVWVWEIADPTLSEIRGPEKCLEDARDIAAEQAEARGDEG